MPAISAQRGLFQSRNRYGRGDLLTGGGNSSFGLKPACIRDVGACFIRKHPTIVVPTPSMQAEPATDGTTPRGENDGLMPAARPVSKHMSHDIVQLLSWFQRRHEEKLHQLRNLQHQQKIERCAADRRHHEMLECISELKKTHF
ncbi:hypothetical protein V7S43_002554 [Phytophthora oleae]|uniref:Uncharacterized protein n=1 Tax=Phytophthora oleae TaxID=2107226 RepID=A0ABD3FZP2_9STRA